MSELDKLVEYLKKKHISYKRVDEVGEIRFCDGEIYNPERHQVIVYGDGFERSWDAICHYGSYGYKEGLLEVMGSIVTDNEDTVEGWLTADEIIRRLEA